MTKDSLRLLNWESFNLWWILPQRFCILHCKDGGLWNTSFQTLFIVCFCRCCLRKRKKEKKVLLPTGVSKSTDHTVFYDVIKLVLMLFSYSACIRRQAGYCCIQYQVCANMASAFSLEASTPTMGLIDSLCTGDYTAIPGNFLESCNIYSLCK
jgi:hypothetical protein